MANGLVILNGEVIQNRLIDLYQRPQKYAAPPLPGAARLSFRNEVFHLNFFSNVERHQIGTNLQRPVRSFPSLPYDVIHSLEGEPRVRQKYKVSIGSQRWFSPAKYGACLLW